MYDAFRKHLSNLGIDPATTKILVGFSGGADSTCLLHLLSRAGLQTAGAHLNHQMRPEADSEAESCRAFCESLDVPFLLGKANVPKISKDLKLGIEEAGRQARYDFLERGRLGLKYDLVATAHTLDDDAETILMNLLRGSGMDGLCGIPSQRAAIIRPLLEFTRAQTLDYCRKEGLATVWDPGNDDLSHTRVWVRKAVMPLLEARFPTVRQNLARTATILEAETGFLDSVAASALEHAEVKLNGPLSFMTEAHEAAFDRHKLLHYPEPLRRRAVRLASRALGGELDFDQTVLAAECCRAGRGSLTAEGGEVTLDFTDEAMRVASTHETPPFRENLAIPTTIESREYGWMLSAKPDIAPATQERASNEAWVQEADLSFRSWEPGDRICPLGFDGLRKLSDLFGEAGLTRRARMSVPIICDSTGPLWVPHVCLANRAAKAGERAIKLSFRPLKPD